MDSEEVNSTGWIGSVVKCDICGYKWIAVFYSESEKLECPYCKLMSNYDIINEKK